MMILGTPDKEFAASTNAAETSPFGVRVLTPHAAAAGAFAFRIASANARHRFLDPAGALRMSGITPGILQGPYH
jgi:hypothetical protein